MEGEWSFSYLNGGENCHVSLIKGEWSFYTSGHFHGGRMVMLQRWSV